MIILTRRNKEIKGISERSHTLRLVCLCFYILLFFTQLKYVTELVDLTPDVFLRMVNEATNDSSDILIKETALRPYFLQHFFLNAYYFL